MDHIFEQLPSLDFGVIKEVYRTFKKQILVSDPNGKSDYQKVSMAVVFLNLLAYEPDSITDFHCKKLVSLFKAEELKDLFKLYEIILEKNISQHFSGNFNLFSPFYHEIGN